MTKLERYIEARDQGAGVRQAARIAGYAGGRPPGSAQKMYRRVCQVREMIDSTQWIEKRLGEAEDDVEQLRDLARAMELLEGVSS